MLFPKRLKIEDGEYLLVVWNDESESRLSLNLLRGSCPCAVCNAEREERSKSYIPLYSGDQLKVARLSIVGNYAVGIEWRDGHNTGIYEFGFIRELATHAKTER